MFLIERKMIFRLMKNDFSFDDFKYTQSLLLFVIMTVALLTNQAVFDNISLAKIEARCMLALFLRFYCLPPPLRF